MGRLSGVGVNFSTRLPYDLGASASGDGAMTLGAGGTDAFEVTAFEVAAAGLGVLFAAWSARRRTDVLSARV
jgi:hypothetical protein